MESNSKYRQLTDATLDKNPKTKVVPINDIAPLKRFNVRPNSDVLARSNQNSLPTRAVKPIDFKATIKKTSKLRSFKNFFNFRQMLINGFVAALITLGEVIPALQTRPILVILPYIWAIIIFNIKSNETFTLAVVLLACAPFLAISGRQFQANIFANLAFLILLIGVITAALELRSNTYDKIVR